MKRICCVQSSPDTVQSLLLDSHRVVSEINLEQIPSVSTRDFRHYRKVRALSDGASAPNNMTDENPKQLAEDDGVTRHPYHHNGTKMN